MNDFDKYIKQKAAEDQIVIPDSIKNRIEQTLTDLPEKDFSKKSTRGFSHIAVAVACFVFITLFLLPNISVAYANALEKIPVIGAIVRVVTIRNYFYSDDYHQMDIDVPEIDDQSKEAFDFINQDVGALTDALVHKFYEDLELIGNNGHGSIYVDYQVVTNTDKWFALEIRVVEANGSGNTYYKYYNVNKLTGQIVQLGDLAKDETFYDVIETEIKRQMKAQMEEDEKNIYWIDDSVIGEDFSSLKENHNFSLNENGDLVIPFDKYEVAPGSMGTPVFVIDKNVFKDHLKTEFADIIS